jgi:hypothetical protein
MRSVLGLACAFLLASASAQAAIIETTSATATSVPGGYRFTNGDVTLTITGGLFNDAGIVTPGAQNARPNAYSIGLGASNNDDSEHTIDGNGDYEVLILAFNQTVQITGFVFSYFDGSDEFDFFFDSDGNGSLNRVLNEVNIPDDGLAIISGMFSTPGKWFGVGADGNDSFKLKAVKYKVANVPLPAAFPLFAFGFGAVSFVLRRTPRR